MELATGRPSLLTAEVVDAACEHVARGAHPIDAFILAGVSRRTAWRWRARAYHERRGVYFDAWARVGHAQLVSRSIHRERRVEKLAHRDDPLVALVQRAEERQRADLRDLLIAEGRDAWHASEDDLALVSGR